MITNLAPESQTLGTLGFVCSVIGMYFKLKSSSAVMGGGGGGGGGCKFAASDVCFCSGWIA